MTFEQYLKNTIAVKKWHDHWLRCEVHADGRLTFYVHPDGVDGDTPIFEVSGNNLKTIHPATNE